MKNFFYLLFCVLLLILSGCTPPTDLGPGYQKTSKKFLEALRWKDFQGAAAMLESEHRVELIELFEPYKDDLNLVESDYIFSRLDEKAGTAASKLLLKYYMLPSTRIKEWTWEADWVLIPRDSEQPGTWLLQGAPPPFP